MTANNSIRLDDVFSDDNTVPKSDVPLTNFYRNVHCVLGLPFDAITEDQAEAGLTDAIVRGRRCFFSTPNLNFLIACLDDQQFRDSVIRSDLSFADGMPIIWISRLLGIPLQERVAGSTLFERLREKTNLPTRVYFFGGPDGVAQKAGQVINFHHSAMKCVGSHSPGFGTIEELSKQEAINTINASEADFLVVALGAKRGQAWIEYNLPRLTVPLISHLGAVVNFVAGTVSRAPSWVGNVGLEWLWRIKEEPALWKRYLADGKTLLTLLFTKVLPSLLAAHNDTEKSTDAAHVEFSICAENTYRISLSGSLRAKNLMVVRQTLQQITEAPCHIMLELDKAISIDSAGLGLLILLFGHQSKIKHDFVMSSVSPSVAKTLRMSCAEYLRGSTSQKNVAP